MITFRSVKPDSMPAHKRLADELNSRTPGKTFIVPEGAGKGFFWTETLPVGIKVIVSETYMNENVSFLCDIFPSFNFCLQFTDARFDTQNYKKDILLKNTNAVQTAVKICKPSNSFEITWPGSITQRSVKIFFNKEHLSRLVGNPQTEELLITYFELLIKNNNPEPIDADYRITLNDLLLENIVHPLRYNYLQNRVLLLMEKFILKVEGKKAMLFTKLKSSGDELSRLMRVEALLVKDFSLCPPTILELSKISAMSATKLKTDFKLLYGLPIYVYYQKNRMLKAKSLLAPLEYSIKEVGRMVGYSNLSHFANSFKKEFGVLPSKMSSMKDGIVVYNT